MIHGGGLVYMCGVPFFIFIFLHNVLFLANNSLICVENLKVLNCIEFSQSTA
jgi:hypothetical protein